MTRGKSCAEQLFADVVTFRRVVQNRDRRWKEETKLPYGGLRTKIAPTSKKGVIFHNGSKTDLSHVCACVVCACVVCFLLVRNVKNVIFPKRRVTTGNVLALLS